MDRKETTEFLRNLLIKEKLTGMGKYWASEVSFNPWTTKAKRVDFVQFIPEGQCHLSDIEKGIFVCYEVKSCKQDIYSGNGLNFYGEKNYIVTTMECYKEIESDIKDGKLWKHINNCNLESSPYYGFLVAVPFMSDIDSEYESPTRLDEDTKWELRVISKCRKGYRSKSMVEMLFNMLRSGKDNK